VSARLSLVHKLNIKYILCGTDIIQNNAIFTDKPAKLLLFNHYSNEMKINGHQDIEIFQSASFKMSANHFTIE